MHEDVAAVLLRGREDRRERPRAGEADERVERQHGADEPEIAVRARQFLGCPRDVRRWQRRERGETRRVPSHERREVVVLRAPERPRLLRRQRAVERAADPREHLAADVVRVHVAQPRLDVEPSGALRRPRRRARAEQRDHVGADPVRVPVDDGRGGR